VPTNAWLIPDDDYLKKHSPPSVRRDTRQPQPLAAGPESRVRNGPASQRLYRLLLSSGDAAAKLSSTSRELVDNVTSGNVIGTLLATFADGSLVSASQQQLTKPLPYSVVRVTDKSQLSVSDSGTALAVVTGTNTIQVLSVSKDGLMTQITARGVFAKQVQPPFDTAQLLAMSKAIDTAVAEGK
jgi:hypothetical protein